MRFITSLITKFNLDEPSSWAGLAAVSTSVGLSVPGEYISPVSLILAGIFGGVAVFVKEKPEV